MPTSAALDRLAGWRPLLLAILASLICLPTVLGIVRSRSVGSQPLELGWEGIVKQSQPELCGPAVIATLVGMIGQQVSQEQIAARARLQAAGVSLQEFADLAEQFGLEGRWFEVTDESALASLPVPSVVHLRGSSGHFAIFEDTVAGYVQLADPARGRLLLPEKQFEREWTGRIFLFSWPTVANRPDFH